MGKKLPACDFFRFCENLWANKGKNLTRIKKRRRCSVYRERKVKRKTKRREKTFYFFQGENSCN